MKFDAYIGRAIRGRIRNAIRDYMKQMDDFPLGHENEIENVPASREADPTNQHRIKVREDEVYLQDIRNFRGK